MAGLHYRLDWDVLDSYFQMQEVVAVPATPETDNIRLYAADNGSGATQLCYVNDAGNTVCLPVSGTLITGTGVANQLAIWSGTSTLVGDTGLTFNTSTNALTVTGSIIDNGLTLGSVVFAGTSGLLSQDNSNLFFDDTNNFLAVGSAGLRHESSSRLSLEQAATDSILEINTHATGSNSYVIGYRSRGTTHASPLIVASADQVFGVSGKAYDGVVYREAAYIGFDVDGTPGSGDMPGRIVFKTTADGASSVTERFRISNFGGWGIAGANFGTAGQYFRSGGAAAVTSWATIDHGSELGGLTDDDHTQYALLLGRSGGQVLTGGTASGDDLTLRSTSNATKGDIFMADAGGNVIIGGGATASRLRLLEASGSGINYTEFVTQPQAANITYTLPADDGTAGEVLSTDGAGLLDWVAAASGSNHAILDGSVHNDSVAQTVSRGSLIYGNATPKWDELVVGASAGMFLRTDATDAMWSTLILPNAITTNNIVFGSATNTYGQSTNLTFDGTDFLLGSDIRARMVAQNRFRHLNSIVIATRTTTQSINDSTFTAVALDATDIIDTDALHDTVTNNSRLTAAIAGKYVCFANVTFDAAANSVAINIEKNSAGTQNNTKIIAATTLTTAGSLNPQLNVSGIASLAAGDHVELWAFQNSGGAINIAASTVNAFFSMAYIGE